MSGKLQSFNLDIFPQKNPPHVKVTQYDKGVDGWVIMANLYRDGVKTAEFASGYTATVNGTTSENTGFTVPAVISSETGNVEFTLTEDMTAWKGAAWCKIVFSASGSQIATSGFWLDNDRAGVEADTVIGAPGFEEQINRGVAEYFDNDPPFFELPSGGQSGQALLSDGSNGAYWGKAQGGGGSGITDEAKQALLSCFQNVAWINKQGQSYYDALSAALYPHADLISIFAVFNQGQNIVYNTDTLDSLKQYLTVKARYSDSSVRNVATYTLSGSLTTGTSTITVSYSGKTTTFNVTVTSNPFADVSNWELGKAIVYPYANKNYSAAMSDSENYMTLKTPITLNTQTFYKLSVATGYRFYSFLCDVNYVIKQSIPTSGYLTQYCFKPQTGLNNIGLVVDASHAVTSSDVSDASVTLETIETIEWEVLKNLQWRLNETIYPQRKNQPFADIIASYDKSMLLTSFIPIEIGKTYDISCNAPYTMNVIFLDSNDVYKDIDDSNVRDYYFKNTLGYAKCSLWVTTPQTATEADVSAIEIYVAEF